MIADGLTKALAKDEFRIFKENLGIKEDYQHNYDCTFRITSNQCIYLPLKSS